METCDKEVFEEKLSNTFTFTTLLSDKSKVELIENGETKYVTF